jgi:flagellar FliL protein
MAASATSANGKPAGKGSLVVTVATLTVLAAVGGGLLGKLVAHPRAASSATAAEAGKPLPYAADIEVRELPAIVANLAAPEEARVRIQVAMVYPKKGVENAALLAAKINDDIIAFVKTLTVADLQGPSGLQALREDLNERAAVRSEGKVREIIIEALVVQ